MLGGGQHFIDFLWLPASRFSKIGSPAPADNGGNFFDNRARFDAGGQVFGDGDHNLNLAVSRRGEHNDARLDLRLERVSQTAERILVEFPDSSPRQLDAGD